MSARGAGALLPLNCLFLALKMPVESATYRAMRREQQTFITHGHEPAIDALLNRSETGSIVDRLMALPPLLEPELSDEWTRAVASRLEAILAQSMRSRIDGVVNQAA